jgi:hypothetical protein
MPTASATCSQGTAPQAVRDTRPFVLVHRTQEKWALSLGVPVVGFSDSQALLPSLLVLAAWPQLLPRHCHALFTLWSFLHFLAPFLDNRVSILKNFCWSSLWDSPSGHTSCSSQVYRSCLHPPSVLLPTAILRCCH